jgi:hypothetical protein
VAIDVALKLYFASLEASSLRWDSASSCKLGVRFEVHKLGVSTSSDGSVLRRRRRSGHLCKDQNVFFFFRGVFVRIYV